MNKTTSIEETFKGLETVDDDKVIMFGPIQTRFGLIDLLKGYHRRFKKDLKEIKDLKFRSKITPRGLIIEMYSKGLHKAEIKKLLNILSEMDYVE